jgi:hypothetical protein
MKLLFNVKVGYTVKLAPKNCDLKYCGCHYPIKDNIDEAKEYKILKIFPALPHLLIQYMSIEGLFYDYSSHHVTKVIYENTK